MDKLICLLALVIWGGQIYAQDPVKPKPKPTGGEKTVFHCVPFKGNYATIARRGDRVTPPLIEWTSTLGTEWTPQRRCQEVSQRLTRAVEMTGRQTP
jgi:hypothetical protein